jgi:hypothetical protein
MQLNLSPRFKDGRMRDTNALRRDRVGAEIGLQLHLPQPIYEMVETYAGTHHIRSSEALRYLIEAGLAAEARALREAQDSEAMSGEATWGEAMWGEA